jgi:hypothetical protein
MFLAASYIIMTFAGDGRVMELYEVQQDANGYKLLLFTNDKEYYFPLSFKWRGILMPDGRSLDWSGRDLPDEAMEVFTEATLYWEGKELARGNLVVFFHKVSQRVILQVRGGKLHDKETTYTTGPLRRLLRLQ